MKVSFKLLANDACVPSRKHRWDAGLDLYCLNDCTIEPGAQLIIKTGIALAGMAANYVLQIWPKSGLSARRGADTGAGIIDSGYRGEILVLFRNFGDETIKFKSGDAVAQMLILPCLFPEIEVVDVITETARGDNGGITKVLGDNDEI